jgi:hypothetical protein
MRRKPCSNVGSDGDEVRPQTRAGAIHESPHVQEIGDAIAELCRKAAFY